MGKTVLASAMTSKRASRQRTRHWHSGAASFGFDCMDNSQVFAFQSSLRHVLFYFRRSQLPYLRVGIFAVLLHNEHRGHAHAGFAGILLQIGSQLLLIREDLVGESAIFVLYLIDATRLLCGIIGGRRYNLAISSVLKGKFHRCRPRLRSRSMQMHRSQVPQMYCVVLQAVHWIQERCWKQILKTWYFQSLSLDFTVSFPGKFSCFKLAALGYYIGMCTVLSQRHF